VDASAISFTGLRLLNGMKSNPELHLYQTVYARFQNHLHIKSQNKISYSADINGVMILWAVAIDKFSINNRIYWNL
jgi:hypothetical protein